MRMTAAGGLVLFVALGATASAAAQDGATEAPEPAAPPSPEPPGAAGLSDPSSTPDEVPPPPADDGTVPPPPTEIEIVDGDFYLEPDPVLRLDGWLRVNDERNATARVAAGILGLVVGAAAVSGAVWAFGLDDPALRATLGSVFVLDAVFVAGLGVAMLNVTTPQEDRYRRWREARERGATAVDVAGFAGEFYAEAEAQRFARILAAISGLSMAAGGAATLALGAAMDFGDGPDADEGRLITLTLGGAFLVTGGLLGLIGLLVKSPIERDWERYQQGLAPLENRRPPSVTVAPAIGDGFAGVALRGEM